MSDSKTERRRNNGGRLEGRALAIRVAEEVKDMMLAEAFVTTRSAGFVLQINKFDGVPRQSFALDDGTKVMVDVVSGYVRKAWTSP